MSVLYHASTNKNLDMIIPKRTLSKDEYIGDYIFATADRTLAIMYLATRGYATIMETRDSLPHIVICAEQSEYQASDKGGAIYELSPVSFIESPQKELSGYELVSKKPLTPLRKTLYGTSLLAMSEAGIDVHFIDEQSFKNLIGNPNQTQLIKSLPVYKQ